MYSCAALVTDDEQEPVSNASSDHPAGPSVHGMSLCPSVHDRSRGNVFLSVLMCVYMRCCVGEANVMN